ncbi:MAG: hypothetical protein ACTSWN_10155, partial [Promethearchaeota archaeon]
RIEIDTSNETKYPIGSVANFTLQVNGSGIDISKTENISINIVQYGITASFDSIPTEVGWNESAEINYMFWINPDDFGKIWLSSQSDAVISNIHVNVSVTWLNGSIPIPQENIINNISVSGSLQTLGFYVVEVNAPASLHANLTDDYQIEFNITAWYDRNGTILPIFDQLHVVKNITITKVSSSGFIGITDEEGNPASTALEQVTVGESITFYIDYLPGSNVTFSIKNESGDYLSEYTNISMTEITPGRYMAVVEGLSSGTYQIEVYADPGEDSDYMSATLSLSVSVAQPFPWMALLFVAGAAVALSISGYKIISYYRIPRMVRIIDLTISDLRRKKTIKTTKVVRSLNEILRDEVKDAFGVLGIKSPNYRLEGSKKEKPEKLAKSKAKYKEIDGTDGEKMNPDKKGGEQ